jgi:hypothetical protein
MEKFKKLFAENWRQFNLFTLFAPLAFTAGITYFLLCDQTAVAEGIGPNTFKVILESVAFYILVPAVVVAYLRFCVERSLFFLWFACLIGTLLCREVHWDWTNKGVFIMLGALALLGYLYYDKLRPQINSRVFVNFIIVVVISYFISEFLLDHNWIRIPKHYRSDIKFRKSLGEFMEVFGHAMLFAIVILTPALKIVKNQFVPIEEASKENLQKN